MEKSSKRGKIPQSDWPLIMARYEAGETLASIARTYDCSPPAISYVVSRSRARQADRDSRNRSPERAGTAADQGRPASEPAETGAGRRSRLDAPAAHGSRGHERAAGDADEGPIPPPRLRRHSSPTGVTIECLAQRIGCRATASPNADRNRRRHRRPAEPETGGPHRSAAPLDRQRPATPSPLSRSEADTRHRLHLPLGNGAASARRLLRACIPTPDRPAPTTAGPLMRKPHARPIRRRAARQRPDFPRRAGRSTTVSPKRARRPGPTPYPARRVPARSSIRSCAPASIATSPPSSPLSTPR